MGRKRAKSTIPPQQGSLAVHSACFPHAQVPLKALEINTLYTEHAHIPTSIIRASTEMNQNSKQINVKSSAPLYYPSLFQELKLCLYSIPLITLLAIFPEPIQESICSAKIIYIEDL